MSEELIPRRPASIDIKIPAADKNCIEYAVVFQARNEDAFLLFHPEFRTIEGRLNQSGKRACREFFAYSRNREYRDAYTDLLRRRLSGTGDGGRGTGDERFGEVDGARKEKALRAFVERTLSLMEQGEDLDPDTVKVIADIAVKLRLIKEETRQEEPPRRYLPERCSECRYKLFIEEQIARGAIVEDSD